MSKGILFNNVAGYFIKNTIFEITIFITHAIKETMAFIILGSLKNHRNYAAKRNQTFPLVKWYLFKSFKIFKVMISYKKLNNYIHK